MHPSVRLLGAAGLVVAGAVIAAATGIDAAQAPKKQQTAKNAPPPPKLSPADAAKTFQTPPDLAFDQVLAEPLVKQPVSLSFDERGRLWVMNYIQYPHPAGLKILSRDIFWRVVYGKGPPPPPNHVRGR